MKRIIASMLAAGVLVGGAGTAAVLAVSPAVAQEAETATETTPPRPAVVLSEVLSALVADGTISQDQADAVAAAMKAKVEQLREQFPQAGHRRGLGPKVKEFLADGVITADELAELPEGHPLRDPDGPAAAYLDDGQLTKDELQQMRQAFIEQRQAEQGA